MSTSEQTSNRANQIINRLVAKLLENPRLAHYSHETVGLIAQRTLVHLMDMAKSGDSATSSLALRIGDDPALNEIPPVVLAGLITPIIEAISGAFA